MQNATKLIATACVIATLGACNGRPTPTADAAETPAAASAPNTDATAAPTGPVKANDDRLGSWTGKWNGVEGTSLDLQRSPDGSYAIRIADLDGEKAYVGQGKDDAYIEFARNGKTETIHPTDGAGTGMKWLAGKKDCLVITVNAEGYCRS